MEYRLVLKYSKVYCIEYLTVYLNVYCLQVYLRQVQECIYKFYKTSQPSGNGPFTFLRRVQGVDRKQLSIYTYQRDNPILQVLG